MGFMVIAHQATRELWREGMVDPFDSAGRLSEFLLWKTPAGAFCGVLLHGMALYHTSPPTALWRAGFRDCYVFLTGGVWGVTAVFYALQLLGGTPVVRSVYGNRIVPLRYVLEPAATSLLLIAMFMLVESVSRGDAEWRRRHMSSLYRTLLFQYLMMVSAWFCSCKRRVVATVTGLDTRAAPRNRKPHSLECTFPAFAPCLPVLRRADLPTNYSRLGPFLNLALILTTWVFFYTNVLTIRGWMREASLAARLEKKVARTFRLFSHYVVAGAS